MAPMVVTDRDADTEANGDEPTCVVFRTVSVFDIGQTDGEPLPEPPREPITGDSHARCIGKLEQLARSMGLAVEYRPLEHAEGYYSERERVIVISTNVGSANAHVRTLMHELAHAHGVTYKDYSRGEAEVIVETAATIVCGSLGLDTSGESIPYIAGWGEDGDLDAIRRHAATVDEIAGKLEQACGLKGGER